MIARGIAHLMKWLIIGMGIAVIYTVKGIWWLGTQLADHIVWSIREHKAQKNPQHRKL